MDPDQTLTIATIGYERATPQAFIETLRGEGVDMVIDVRAVASSRRPGFSKNALAAMLDEAGMRYLHLRGLGTPTEGRIAARAGDHKRMHAIFHAHLETLTAQTDLVELIARIRAGARVCLLCYEADPKHCHRTLIAQALNEQLNLEVHDLRPDLVA